jgi:Cu-processing system permease protein
MKPGSTTFQAIGVEIRDAGAANDVGEQRGRKPSAATHVWLIATKEFADRFRSGWVIACVLVWLGAIGLTSFLGLVQAGQIGVQGYERTTISLLNLVQYLVPLLGLLLGHDLIVGEAEEKTLRLIVAAGVSRPRLLFGKLVGGGLALAVPLVLGFIVSGALIGLAARDSQVAPFLRLAVSGLVLGIIFLGVGVAISSFARSRVQSLVVALLTWCCAVFVFDLVALGLTLSTNAPVAADQIEVICDPTHLNAAVDIHSAFEPGQGDAALVKATMAEPELGWLAANPLDLFRAFNLPSQTGGTVAWSTLVLAMLFWLVAPCLVALWKLHRTDL